MSSAYLPPHALLYLPRTLVSLSKSGAGGAGGEQEEKKGMQGLLRSSSPLTCERAACGDRASQARPDRGSLSPEMVRSLSPP